MTDKIDEEFKKMLINKIPAGSLGTGEDVANCAVFASDMANYINGETIHVNGGNAYGLTILFNYLLRNYNKLTKENMSDDVKSKKVKKGSRSPRY